MPTIALVTCERLPDLDPDERLLLDALVARGAEVDVVVWSDPAAVWRTYDVVVVRSTWDYSVDADAFIEWATRVDEVSRLLNPSEIIAWNTDKRYLRDLLEAGIKVVPTTFIEPGERLTVSTISSEAHAEFVVKPAVSAGSRDTMRYSVVDGLTSAAEHVDRLLEADRVVMVQPYFPSVDTIGETAMVFIDGEFSHSIRKGPMLTAGREGNKVEGLYVEERITTRQATDAELALARQVLATLPAKFAPLLYARVDVIADADGSPTLLELELTEPSLFFGHSAEAADRMAAAIISRGS